MRRWYILSLLLLVQATAWAAVSPSAPTVPLELVKRGNVRYVPNVQSPNIVTTLSPGERIEALGRTEGRPEWFTIRFPRQGRAWVHQKNLAPTDDPKIFRVTIDGASVRADARINGELVGQLALDELVELNGVPVGDWKPIHPANAVAYIHQSVVRIGTAEEQALQSQALGSNAAEQLWESIRFRYGHYRQIFERDNKESLLLDWGRLDSDLGEVVTKHPSIRTRLKAQKLRGGLDTMVRAAVGHQQTHRVSPRPDPVPPPRKLAAAPSDEPVAAVPRAPRPVTPAVTPVAPPPTNSTPETAATPPTVNTTPVAVANNSSSSVAGTPTTTPGTTTTPVTTTVTPASQPNVLASLDDPTEAAPGAAAGSLVGWLEQRDDATTGTGHVLLGPDGAVVAHLEVPAGSTVQLAEYFWRRVSVLGSSRSVPGAKAPVLRVDSVRLEN